MVQHLIFFTTKFKCLALGRDIGKYGLEEFPALGH
jgi:hypothetical protein